MRDASEAPNKYRVREGLINTIDLEGMNGMFRIPVKYDSGGQIELRCIASDGVAGMKTGWEHVSVSVWVKGKNTRLPNWSEMNFIKETFWKPEETVVQFHPKHSEYIDNAEVLHLWRLVGMDHPLPPQLLIGDKKKYK